MLHSRWLVDIVMSRLARGCLALTVFLGLLAGCASDWDAARATAASAGARSPDSASGPVVPRAFVEFASLPDRGELAAPDTTRDAVTRGAYTAYPVRLSEQHALNAARAGGRLLVSALDGQVIALDYERHVEHPDGNWTWIGRDANRADAIITFGDKAAFGVLPRTRGGSLRLTMAGGRAWLVATDSDMLGDGNRAVTRSGEADYLVPPKLVPEAASNKATTATSPSDASITFFAENSTIDVVVGYSTGLAAALGGQSQAVTRITHLVDIANQSYANSVINATLRLAGTVPVDYPDATDNKDALQRLSGRGEEGHVAVDSAFAALRTARETHRADLVALVRHFRAPQNNGCGIAWLIGGGQTGIEPGDAAYGYSVVSDGLDLDESDGGTYFCRDESLVHELGHNMGQAHNAQDSDKPGVHAYSYGYREAAPEGFYTTMAYRLTSGGQTAIRHFANPNISYDGRPTGIVNVSDNARSMNQVLPAVAAFRVADEGAGHAHSGGKSR